MKISKKTILGKLPNVGAGFRGTDLAQKCSVNEPPLRAELFSSDQMEKHGKALASKHKLSSGHAPDRLLGRLAANEDILSSTRSLLTEAVSTDRRITPAGEWLLDNFYLTPIFTAT